MTRLPELRDRLDNPIDPDAADAAEIEELTRTVPKLIQQLPDVINEQLDIRHKVALSEMISGLTSRLDQIRPLAVSHLLCFELRECMVLIRVNLQLGQQFKNVRIPESAKLGHIRATAYEKFLRSIEVA